MASGLSILQKAKKRNSESNDQVKKAQLGTMQLLQQDLGTAFPQIFRFDDEGNIIGFDYETLIHVYWRFCMEEDKELTKQEVEETVTIEDISDILDFVRTKMQIDVPQELADAEQEVYEADKEKEDEKGKKGSKGQKKDTKANGGKEEKN